MMSSLLSEANKFVYAFVKAKESFDQAIEGYDVCTTDAADELKAMANELFKKQFLDKLPVTQRLALKLPVKYLINVGADYLKEKLVKDESGRERTVEDLLDYFVDVYLKTKVEHKIESELDRYR